ncbi:MAG TPA: hypothetical protein VE685_05545 [Thermoanaerobaculia bacterium]|nr:hypothetical protein [Thermoanaerobaculia bacterium]
MEAETHDFLLEQYKALREEILGVMERVVRIQLVGITGIPLVIAAGEKYDLGPVVMAGPVVTIIFSLILLYEQNGAMRAGRYIRCHLEPRLSGKAYVCWEEWLELDPENRKPERFFAWAAYIAFSLYYGGGTYLAYRSLSAQYGARVGEIFLLIYLCLFVVALYLVIRNLAVGTEWRSEKRQKGRKAAASTPRSPAP